MKTALIVLGLSVQLAFAQSTIPELKTLDGKTYKSVRLQQVHPNHVNVSYVDDRGGWQFDNLALTNLPAETIKLCEERRQTQKPKAVAAATGNDSIKTKEGAVLSGVRIENYTYSHLSFSYVGTNGSLLIANMDFDLLEESIQKRFGYDKEKRTKLEAQKAEQNAIALEQYTRQLASEQEAQRRFEAEMWERRKVLAMEASASAALQQARAAQTNVQQINVINQNLNQNNVFPGY